MQQKLMRKSKKGVTSLYVVIFATILFGVITLAFTRIIISEANQSSNDDLSRSAYDAALAGVEDAKYMINKYYSCLDTGGNCDKYNIFSSDTDCSDGFPLARKLYSDHDGEVLVQESGSAGSATAADQAYTCVLVSDEVPDYRGTLTSDTRTRVIPLALNGTAATSSAAATGAAGGTSGSGSTGSGSGSTGGGSGSAGASGATTPISNVNKVRFSWYSELNQGTTGGFTNVVGGSSLPKSNDKPTPPIMQLTLITVPQNINLSNLHEENNNAEDEVYSTMVFVPTSDTAGSTTYTQVAANTIRAAGNVVVDDSEPDESKVSSQNSPLEVKCATGREFACVVELEIKNLVPDDGSAFLVVSLPYGDAYSDFAVAMFDPSGKPIQFKGSQISVDSTGRTNQLFRRVEVRLDPADLYYPYPQYALESGGSTGDGSITKNFWITSNCWVTNGNGTTPNGVCLNNGEL